MANPYRKNPSFFASPDDYDYIVDSGSSKERTIKASAEQAKMAADQEKARFKEDYNPKDNTSNPSAQLHGAMGAYNDDKKAIKEFLNSGTREAEKILKEWDKIDISDKKAVNDFVIKLDDRGEHMKCHTFTAILSELLEKRGIEYEACMGMAQIKYPVFHSWIRINNETYEKFRNNKQYEVPVIHKTIDKYLRKKK